MVVATTLETPNLRCVAPVRALTDRWQLGFVTMNPLFAFRVSRCTSSKSRWLWFNLGTARTFRVMRNAEELLMTA